MLVLRNLSDGRVDFDKDFNVVGLGYLAIEYNGTAGYSGQDHDNWRIVGLEQLVEAYEAARVAVDYRDFLMRVSKLTLGRLCKYATRISHVWKTRRREPSSAAYPEPVYADPIPKHIRAILWGIHRAFCVATERFVLAPYRSETASMLQHIEVYLEFASRGGPRLVSLYDGRISSSSEEIGGAIPYAHLKSILAIINLGPLDVWGSKDRLEKWCTAINHVSKREIARRSVTVCVYTRDDSWNLEINVLTGARF